MKRFVFLAVIFLLFFCPSTLLAERFATVDSTRGAKINLYIYQTETSDLREKPLLLVHGFNSKGNVWDNYVTNLTQNGYDIIVVDMRGNYVDTDGDDIIDAPVVGDSWGYGVRDLGDDVGVALQYGIDYLNQNLPDRNYTKADVVTHSTGALAVTAYSRSLGLVAYRNNIDAVIELAPPNNGSTSLMANIKQTTQIIPSVFCQSMTAYEYALEFISGKVWIPGGRMESENLRKELMPDSLFLKSLKGLGPEATIKTFVAIGDEDWVVGDWSPVIEGRDDIGYEYFIGVDHFDFCNSELIIQALLDKLEKGDESRFFARYKPYRNKNLLAFLSGPGIDHPDDTFDVVTFAKGIAISPSDLFKIYLRIAGRKQKEALLKYWDAFYQFDKAQQEIDAGETEENIVEKWDAALSEINTALHDYFADASEEYLECPDIAILANGCYNEMAKLVIEKIGEPVRIVDHTFSPAILSEQKLLLIPSGGLSGLSGSAIFKKKLAEFVKNGGTIVCFSQQYGYDFNALPSDSLKGYGWQEDVSCHSKAAYIETFHQILSSQNDLYPDIKIDGYFTDYPENSTVLLRRTKNLMPAMLAYRFEKGLVIAADIYSDWGYSNGQASLAEINLVRNLVRWSKFSNELPEYKLGEDFRRTLDAAGDFSQIEMILKSPDNSVLERKTSTRAVYEAGVTLNQPGIYCVDYILYDSDSEIIQPQTEGFYFSYCQPPAGTMENPDFTFDITSDSEHYTIGSEAVFTLHISNNTDRDEVVKCNAEFLYPDVEFTESIEVSAGSTVSFEKRLIVTKTNKLVANFYSSGNDFLGRAERGITVFRPSVNVKITTDKMQYAPGQKILIDAIVTNNSEVGLNTLLIFNIVNSENSEVYYSTKTVNIGPGISDSWAHEFNIPEDAPRGIYKIKLNAFSNSLLVGSSSVNIEIPGPFVFDDLPNSAGLLTLDMQKLVFKPGEPILAKLIINNEGDEIDSAVLDIRVLQSIDKAYISGTVTDENGIPVRGAQVNSVYTNSEGKYALAVSTKGKYIVNVKAVGYDSVSKEMDILAGDYVLDVSLAAAKYGNLSGALEGAIGSRLVLTPVNVAGSDVSVRSAVTSSECKFEFRYLPVGAYRLNIQPEDVTEDVQINEGDNVFNLSLPLTPPSQPPQAGGGGGETPVSYEESEPNNDFDTADEISPSSSIRGKIYDYGDQDYFSLAIDSPSTLHLSVKNVADGLSAYLRIYNSERREIIFTAGLPGEDIDYSLEISTPGTYYFLLRDTYNTFSSLEEYNLEVILDSGADGYEPNNDFATAKEIDIRNEIAATIFPQADEDYFAIDINQKGILYVQMQNVPTGLRPSLKILDATARIIAQKGGSSGEKIAFKAEIEGPGRYYLLVRDWYSNFSSADAYSFTAYFIDTLDEYEPNDAKEEASLVEFASSCFGTISVAGDSDFYKLSVPDSGKVIVYLNDVPSNIRPYIKLYRATTESWIYLTAGGDGENLVMEFDVTEPSNYFIQVQDRYNSQASLLRYRLHVIYIPDSACLPEDPTIFNQTIEVSDISGVKEIDVGIPGIDECGKYYLQAALSSSQANSQVVERFYISDLDIFVEPAPLADIEVSCLEAGNIEFSAGGIASFRFKAVNKGGAGGICKIDFRFIDLYADTLSEFLEPGAEKDLQFEFMLPVDLEEGFYEAEYDFNGETYVVNFKIAGLKIDVETEFKDNVFKLGLQSIGSIGTAGFFAEVRCGIFEDRKDFILTDTAELIFDMSDVSGEQKIYYGIYFSSGKALYLNSYLLEGEYEEVPISIKVLGAGCDKESYVNGETVCVSWNIDSQEVSLLRMVADLIGPDSGATEVINEDVYLSEGENILEKEINDGIMEAGLYRIVYRFLQEEEVVVQGSVFFDVEEEIRVELQSDEKLYFCNRYLKFNACCFSSRPLRGRLKLYLDGRLVGLRPVRIDGYKEFAFYVRVPKPGEHQIYCTLGYEGTSIESSKLIFNVSKQQKYKHKCPFFRRYPFLRFWHRCKSKIKSL